MTTTNKQTTTALTLALPHFTDHRDSRTHSHRGPPLLSQIGAEIMAVSSLLFRHRMEPTLVSSARSKERHLLFFAADQSADHAVIGIQWSS